MASIILIPAANIILVTELDIYKGLLSNYFKKISV